MWRRALAMRVSCSLPVVSFLLFGSAWSQPGTVVSEQKISDTQGSFTAPLGDLDEFGGAVAYLGDLDGNGSSVAAIAVGAIGDDDGGADRGAVHILFLDSSGSVLSYQTISDTQGGFAEPLGDLDEFGGAVAWLGDLDGNGPSVAALAVGAALDDDGGTNRGAVYILFLSSTGSVLSYQKISDTAGGFLEPLGNADEFGGALAWLGDLDGDGPSVAALAVGTIGDDDGGGGRGAVYILFLDAGGSVLSYQKISDTQGNFTATIDNADEFGSSVAGLGDLDGAGSSAGALAVGAIGDDDGGLNRGAVYVLFLNANGTVASYQKISDTAGGFTAPIASENEFGGALADLGDIDGAGGGARTLAVGASPDDDGGLDRGAVYVLFLDATGNVVSYQKISDTQGSLATTLDDEDQFGGAVVALGDLDGAGGGVLGLAVGAVGDDDGGTDRGAVYVLSLDGVVVPSDAFDPTARTRNGLLGQASPNPFRPRTTIAFRNNQAGRVRIDVWDARGRLVRTLVDKNVDVADHLAVWDGSDNDGRRLPAGTYFYRMTVNGETIAGSQKVLLLRQ